MGGNRQRKSSSFMSVFNIFKSSRHRGGHQHHDAYHEEGTRARKVWPSDEDRGRWGVAEPGIDTRAAAFIAQYKKRVSESEVHCAQPQ
ncbi:hypothetical protein QN277_021781 [Acacia crassicarpa]|uniref:Uncharacterized protein n=1 Tax=Acacia crassicarpa TaxID=499986 RepID=A0AAE1JPL4_9FABA|nr:hypothetical protein K1719_024848 [Acacia pycnantha]KAK4273363.1 hypothetical protein QN277_021781 [Acacia crassicarpa]